MRGRRPLVVVLLLGALVVALWALMTRAGDPQHDAPASRTRTVDMDTATQNSKADGAAHRPCAPAPSSCGYPDATNTGVPPGTPLLRVPEDETAGAGWVVRRGGWIEVTEDGAVLEGIETELPVEVSADGVTIRHAVIRANGETAGIGLRGADGTVIESSEIGPAASAQRLKYGIQDVDGDATGTRIVGNEISRVATGIAVHAGLVADNYLHSLEALGDDHVNGIVSNGSEIPLEIRHNTVLNPLDQTDAIALFQDFGAEANRIVTDNLVAGGSYTLYAGAPREGGPVSWNIQVVGNRFARAYHPDGGMFGPATSFDAGGEGNRWTDNIWDDSGLPVPPP